MCKKLLKLFVTGKTVRSLNAIENLKRICSESYGEFEIEIIDVLEHPQMAEDAKIIATPTLIKELPLPIRRIIGDLSDKESVIVNLNIIKKGEPNG